ncbi:hypothetical protein AK812_SmicGene40668 [Symbiodinium microadriaticum]|uniref:Uncharacterized protein n=1 Tax=Symbiodinium microadriaticum TaxID=2951 RepID=A0A1Q9C889_SYMMI|nr:hypothetical protein AK812_SmicGene40668 [Symbiodinium microadriaticum]
MGACAALTRDGSVITFGAPMCGGLLWVSPKGDDPMVWTWLPRRSLQVAVVTPVLLAQAQLQSAQRIPECQGTMLSCLQEGETMDDPCSKSDTCMKTYHTCPQRGVFRQCARADDSCAAGERCNIRCWGKRAGTYASCSEVPDNLCQDSYVLDDSGNGMHCRVSELLRANVDAESSASVGGLD